MEDVSRTSTIELAKEFSKLEKEIELKIFKYNLIRLELIRQIPTLITEEEFQEKFIELDNQCEKGLPSKR